MGFADRLFSDADQELMRSLENPTVSRQAGRLSVFCLFHKFWGCFGEPATPTVRRSTTPSRAVRCPPTQCGDASAASPRWYGGASGTRGVTFAGESEDSRGSALAGLPEGARLRGGIPCWRRPSGAPKAL
jgi:hypothetical protein